MLGRTRIPSSSMESSNMQSFKLTAFKFLPVSGTRDICLKLASCLEQQSLYWRGNKERRKTAHLVPPNSHVDRGMSCKFAMSRPDLAIIWFQISGEGIQDFKVIGLQCHHFNHVMAKKKRRHSLLTQGNNSIHFRGFQTSMVSIMGRSYRGRRHRVWCVEINTAINEQGRMKPYRMMYMMPMLGLYQTMS